MRVRASTNDISTLNSQAPVSNLSAMTPCQILRLPANGGAFVVNSFVRRRATGNLGLALSLDKYHFNQRSCFPSESI